MQERSSDPRFIQRSMAKMLVGMVLPHLLISQNQVWRVEAALCETRSRLFHGVCILSSNCGRICEQEGYNLSGRCKMPSMKCMCMKDCGSGGGGGGDGGSGGGGDDGGGGGSSGSPCPHPPCGGRPVPPVTPSPKPPSGSPQPTCPNPPCGGPQPPCPNPPCAGLQPQCPNPPCGGPRPPCHDPPCGRPQPPCPYPPCGSSPKPPGGCASPPNPPGGACHNPPVSAQLP